ncbi:hypothetical protein ZIOFF_035612 [Zingiber officinale]|uniref:Uncharacterized protein n=1 Tax=Zingiber officinale TaxID=94328 RepID=A0A8J5G9X0_ZINOF|nr:hypothetical protein ZIOFF_035612 [Zingiber officinale]
MPCFFSVSFPKPYSSPPPPHHPLRRLPPHHPLRRLPPHHPLRCLLPRRPLRRLNFRPRHLLLAAGTKADAGTEEPRKMNKKEKKAKVKKDKWGQPLLVPVDDAEQASEDEQFQWTVGEKVVVPEEGTESHELTKVVVSDSGNFRGLAIVTFQGHFDDVERAPILPSKPPKETKEMDENKSKKGLAEIYEEEYAQKTGLAPALLSASDKLKIEATMLFKKISLKLDALSHFHFAPKPVIEDMSIQVNVPALAMEEVAPLAVSDAAMLAPEEIFHGKGNIKEEAELTKEERKRRRANQKRRFR